MTWFRSTLRLPSLLPLLGCCALACREGAPAATPLAAVRADSAGVEVVQNPRQDDRFATVRTDPDSVLRDEHGEVFLFDALPSWAARTTGGGQTIVLSPQEAVADVFGPDGVRLRRLGRRGDGPGELRSPFVVLVRADTIHIYDPQRLAVLGWGWGGDSLLAQVPVGESDQGMVPLLAREGRVLGVRRRAEGDSTRVTVGWSADTASALRFVYPTGRAMPLPCLPMPVRRPPLLTPSTHASAHGDRAIVSGSDRYEIWVMDAGRIVRSIRRDVPLAPADREALRLAAGTGVKASLGGRRCAVEPAELAELLGSAPHAPAINGLALLNDGSIWVERTLPRSSDPRADAFDDGGTYLYSIRGRLPIGRLPDGRYLIPVDDESTGGLVVRIARIVPPVTR